MLEIVILLNISFVEWKPVNVITRVQDQTDNINRMIIITESTIFLININILNFLSVLLKDFLFEKDILRFLLIHCIFIHNQNCKLKISKNSIDSWARYKKGDPTHFSSLFFVEDFSMK